MSLKIAATQLLISMVLLALTAAAFAEDSEKPAKPDKLFSNENTLSVTITGPWKDIERNDDVQDPYPATIEFTDSMGNPTRLDLTVERRGITRQKVCKFPPIKLRFEKETVKGTTFRGEKSLKMVTHCNKGSVFVQYYVLEMLAYQMFNLITDYSFRVRPLSVTYTDSKGGKEYGPVFAFLIEDDGDMAKRNDQKKLHIERTTPGRLDSDQAANVALFQYMISNLDWAATFGPSTKECCHNAKLIGHDPETDPIFPVPYDFDSSGLVNAKYASPPQGLPVNRTTQRLYRGFCRHNSSMPASRQLFLEQEQAIYALVENEDLLNGSSKKKTLRFLGDFFEILKNDQEFQDKIIDECRN